MTVVYNIIFLLVALFHLPLYIVRRKFHRGFFRRLGFLPRAQKFDRPVWVHAVSVGEALTVRELISQLRLRLPGVKFVISTVTATGNTVVRGYAHEDDFVTYLPFDISFILKRVLHRVSPRVFIIAETELWPNLINTLSALQIPLAIVNGRISDRSFKGYRLIRRMFRPLVARIAAVMTQSDLDAQRFLRLGATPEKVHITGNMKFDAVKGMDEGADHSHLRRRLGVSAAERLLVAGSTHPGEEEMVLSAYTELRQRTCEVKLLIAPRHPERADQIARLIERADFECVKTSSIQVPQLKEFAMRTVFVLDTVGELVEYYGAADLVFVGGSLVKKGGHNILEPAALAKPVLFGPHMENFRDIADMFLQRKAALRVESGEGLLEALSVLVNDPARAAELGERARRLVHENSGSVKRAVAIIERLCTSAT